MWSLAILIPATVCVAIGEWLVASLGFFAGVALTIPAAFISLNLLPLLIGGKSVQIQWRLWLAVLLIWSWLRWEQPGVVGLFAKLWFVIFALNLLGCSLLAVKHAMGWGNRWRVAVLIIAHGVAVASGFLFGWAWAVAGGALIAAFYTWAVLRPCSQWLGRVVYRLDTPDVRITIDDGPDPHDTPMILDLLDQHGTKAVFFMIGEKVLAHPELAREVVRRGHEIGNHTMTHPQASFWCAGPQRTRREIEECQRVIEQATGVSPRWFRAPVGHRNGFTHPVTDELGLQVMAWKRRGYDAVETNPEKVLARILPISPGDIVLLHEATPIAGKVVAGVLAATHEKSRRTEPTALHEVS